MASILKSFSLKRDTPPADQATGKETNELADKLADKLADNVANDGTNEGTDGPAPKLAQQPTGIPVSTKAGSVSVLKANATTTNETTNETTKAPNDLDSESTPIAARGVAARIDGNIIDKQKAGSNGLVEFNLDDIVQQGRDHLGSARAEAEAMLEAARVEGEQIKAQARKEGHAEGVTAAIAEIDKRIAKEADAKAHSKIQALHNAVMQMRTQYNSWMQQYAEVLTRTSLAAAERLTRQEIRLPNASLLAVEPDSSSVDGNSTPAPEHLLVRWAREALHSTRSAGKLTLAVHPDTLAELGKSFDELLADPDLPEQAVVIPDETLTVGDVVVRQDGGEIRAGLDAQLQRLREELMGDDLPDHGSSSNGASNNGASR